MNRRQWMALSAGTFAAGPRPAAAQQAVPAAQDAALPLPQYQPKSMLHVPETHVPRSRFPVIDFHTHITFAGATGAVRFGMDPANCLAVMDRKNIRTMVDVTGGYGEGSARRHRQTEDGAPRPFYRLHRARLGQSLR